MRALSIAFAGLLVGSAAESQERSFVGRKLPPIEFTDTEGHTIVPAHYQGSVLVMMTGIPW